MKREGLKHVIYLTYVFTIAFGFLFLCSGQLLAWNGPGLGNSKEVAKGIFSLKEGRIGMISGQEEKAAEFMDVLVSGTVTDNTGNPIPGVTVSVPGTTIGTATDINGNYSLNVPDGSSLVFSFIGFQSQTVEVGGRSMVDVVLNEDMTSLDEVIVVGYGVQRKSDITGTVASLPKERLEMVPNLNIAQAIQGAVAGVT